MIISAVWSPAAILGVVFVADAGVEDWGEVPTEKALFVFKAE